MTKNSGYALSGLVILLSLRALGAPNDDFADRTRLPTGNIRTNGTMSATGYEKGEPFRLFDYSGGGSVWWVWTASESGPATATVTADVLEGEYAPGTFPYAPEMFLSTAIGESIVQLTHLYVAVSYARYDQRLVASTTFQAIAGQPYVLRLEANARVGDYDLEIAQSAPPALMLDAPAAGSVFKHGAPIALSAQVFDSDSSLQRVTFYYGSGWGEEFTQIGTATHWPFTLVWSNAPPRQYQIVARGWDMSGASGVSLPLELQVVPVNDAFAERPPVFGASVNATGTCANASREADEPLHNGGDKNSVWWSWTAPADGFATISAAAWDVGIYTGSQLSTLTLVTNGTYEENGARAVFPIRAGAVYQIAVTGYDEVSLAIRASLPPYVTVQSPAANSHFVVGSPIPVHVTSGDPEGSLASLEVFFDGTITNVTADSFSTVLTNVPPGGYFIRAAATDATGITTLSSPSYFYVDSPAIPPPPNDNFADRFVLNGSSITVTGSNLRATTEAGEGGAMSVWWSWIAPASGPATVTFDGSSGSYEAHIYAGNRSSAAEAVFGPSIFLNSPLGWYNIRRATFQAQAGVPYQIRLSSQALPPHLQQAVSVVLNIGQSQPPTVGIVRPEDEAQFVSGETVHLSATPADGDGTVDSVAFFVDRQKVGTVTAAPFDLPISFTADYRQSHRFYVEATDNAGITTRSLEQSFYVIPVPPANDDFENRLSLTGSSLVVTGSTERATREQYEPGNWGRSVWWTWTPPMGGNYILTAEGGWSSAALAIYTGSALSNLVLAVQGDPVVGTGYQRRAHLNAVAGATYQIVIADADGFAVSIIPGLAPAVHVISPTNGTELVGGAQTTFEVQAGDPDGSIQKVDFYLNNVLLGTRTNPPYALEFMAAGALVYDFGNGFRERCVLRAIATDDEGIRTHSAEVECDVRRPANDTAANDSYADRFYLTGLLASGQATGGTTSLEPGEPAWFGGSQGSTWWAWRAPGAGNVVVRCEAQFLVLAGSSSLISNLQVVAVSESQDPVHTAEFQAEAGRDYQIAVITAYPSYKLTLLLTRAEAFLTLKKDGDNAPVQLDLMTLSQRDWTLEASDDLRNWSLIATDSSRRHSITFFDVDVPPHSMRFYRVRAAP